MQRQSDNHAQKERESNTSSNSQTGGCGWTAKEHHFLKCVKAVLTKKLRYDGRDTVRSAVNVRAQSYINEFLDSKARTTEFLKNFV